MSQNTSIEWTDATWNPVRGCSRVSEGCRECYAEKTGGRFCGPGKPFDGFVKITKSGPRWTGKVELVEKHLMDPLKWKQPKRIFVNSMSDLLHEKLSFKEIGVVVRVMLDAPWHTYQVLTKRASRLRHFSEWWAMQTTDPLPAHIWWGVSVEDQPSADERIPELLASRVGDAVREL